MKTKTAAAKLVSILQIAVIFGFLLIPKTGSAASISCGQTVAGATTSDSEVDQYSFSGSAGQILSFSFWSTPNAYYCEYPMTADIYDPAGEWVTNITTSCNGGAINVSLPATGIYTVLVHSENYNQTGVYSLSLQSVTDGGCANLGVIVCGGTVISSTTNNTEMDTYSYSGATGQILSFSFWSTPNAYYCEYPMTADIYDPAGKWVTNITTSCNGGAINVSLPATGIYTVLVHSENYNQTGVYSLSLQSVTDGGCDGFGTISCGGTTYGSTTNSTQMNSYELVANTGEHVVLSDNGFSGMIVDIYDPTGSNIVSIGSSTSTNYVFTGTGIYTLLVHSGSYTGTGSYSLSLTVFGGCMDLPTVTVTPTHSAVLPGGSTSFTATASGPTPLAYQWWFGRTQIMGATNITYGIVNMQTNDTGDYTVVVSNPGGSVTSAPPAVLSLGALQLSLKFSGAGLTLSWPTNYTGFTLETTTNLSSANWSMVSPVPVVINGQNTVTNSLSRRQQFYRLSQ